MKRALWLPALACALACTTPLAEGERLYREGDRLGALESWRAIPEDSFEYADSRERIARVEAESYNFASLYRQRAGYREDQGRLGEALRYYRLALKLQPDDLETLAYVQTLARTLAERKAALGEQYDAAREANDLATARERLDEIRVLDKFDPTFQTKTQVLSEAIRLAVNAEITTGRRLNQRRDFAGAERSFRFVLELAPDNLTAHSLLGDISSQREAEAKAASARSAAFASSKSYASEDETSGGLYRHAKQTEERADEKKMSRDDSEAFVLYAEAIVLYEKAIEANPKHPDAKRKLDDLRRELLPDVDDLIEDGRRAYRAENIDRARVIWDQVLKIDPENERAQAYFDHAVQQLRNLDRFRPDDDVAGGSD